MEFAFEVVAARSKREDPDAPAQVPMRPQQAIRQSLSADQKKVRRQMSRKTASFDTQPCIHCGLPVTQADPDSWTLYTYPRGLSPTDDQTNCPKHPEGHAVAPSKTSTKETSMSGRREAEILQAMATASLADQRTLATELASLRTQRAASLQADRDIDLADTVVRAHLTPVATHTLHTAATDWVGEDLTVYSGDPSTEVRTEATLWFNKTSAAVKADSEEFAIQAEGMANRVAGRFGEMHAQAHAAFMDHVAHLFTKSAGSEAGPNASSQGESTITDYDTKADQDPLFAEDWAPAGDMGVHPTPVNLAENTSTGGGTAGDPVEKGASRRTASDDEDDDNDAPFGEMQPIVDHEERDRGLDPEDQDDWYEREASKRTASQTCSVCGDAIAKDPSGEDPSTYHHDNGEKHDHEAQPGSKESRRKQAAEYGGGSPKEGDTAKCHKDGGAIQFFDGQWMHLKGTGDSHNDVYPPNKDERNEVNSARKTAVSLTNVGVEGEFGVGTTPSGERVKFRLSEKDKADLKAVLYSDLNVNFSGVTVDESDIVKDASRKTAGDQVSMSVIPNCDVCKVEGGIDKPAKYDCKLVGLGGSWGYACERHFDLYGPGQVGTGFGQRLVQASKVAGSEVGPKDPATGESGLDDVEVGDEDDRPAHPWEIGETQGFVSGASLRTASEDDVLDDEQCSRLPGEVCVADRHKDRSCQESTGDGAADVADVRTPGGEAGYPQPHESSLSLDVVAAFRAKVQANLAAQA